MSRLKKCQFRTCEEDSNNKCLLFHHFRKHDHLKWIEACQKDSLKTVSVFNLTHNFYVCNKHFLTKDYTRKLSPYKRFLNSMAVPSHHGDDSGECF